MKIYNGFTRKNMESRFEIEEEILDYINRLGTVLININKELKAMKEQIVQKDKEITELKEELKVVPKVAGRKSKFTENQKKQIRDLRRKGVSIKALAEYYNCSTTLIHKIVKDIDVDLRRHERGVKITTTIKKKEIES